MATIESFSKIEYRKEHSFIPNSIENEKEISDSKKEIQKREFYNERSVFYKKPIKKNNYKLEIDFNDAPQEIRRQQLLYCQKKNRNTILNAKRELLEDAFNDENEEESEEEMEKETEEPKEEMEIDIVKKKKHKIHTGYARKLMLSEWMLEVPQDFTDKWIMVPCPVGKRILIVACRGFTRMYSRKGVHLMNFMSILPGGNPKTNRNTCTILDCIWLADKKVIYVLDLLVWSNQEMLNCEAECRFYWLKSRMGELNESIKQYNWTNDYPILLLPTIPCDQNFYDCLESFAPSIALDGLLFYHKEADYTCGQTPLVTWLKTYMVPEILGMNVPELYDHKPNNYINFEHHVLEVQENNKKLKERRCKTENQWKTIKQDDME